MALEKFACEPVLLSRVAQHYTADGPVLGQQTINTLQALDKWMVGTSQSKYFAMALFDLLVHRAPPQLGCSLVPSRHTLRPPLTRSKARRVCQHSSCMRECSKSTQSRRRSRAPTLAALGTTWSLVLALPKHDSEPICLVPGYDAGYYGYGWSDVYAADLFEAMASTPAGMLSAQTGSKLRDQVLGPCATRSGASMLRTFLGREPSEEAWRKRNGLQ